MLHFAASIMDTVKIVIPALPCDLTNYVNAIEAQGAEAAVKHCCQDFDINDFDGLILPGGIDIDPIWYGCINKSCGEINDELDKLQERYLKAFVEAKKPVLGICRGHQLVNVFFGGKLNQDISTKKYHARDILSGPDKFHIAEISGEDSWFKPIYGDKFEINSSHHQASEVLGEDLIVDLYSATGDRVIEGTHHRTLPIWTTQWHPERCRASKMHPDVVDGYKVLEFYIDKVREISFR